MENKYVNKRSFLFIKMFITFECDFLIIYNCPKIAAYLILSINEN